MSGLTWDRPSRIRALAWTLPDVTPAPAGMRYGDGRRRAGPSRWERCVCDNGHVADRFGRLSRCQVCDGKGRVRVDAYTLETVQTAEQSAPARTRRVMCDRCGGDGVWKHARCEPCSGTGQRTIPDVRVPAALVRARFVASGTEIARLREQGSYDELERALETLAREEPKALRPWLGVRVHGTLDEGRAGGWLRVGDRHVAERMPRRVLVPGQVRQAWIALQDGRTLRERCLTLSRRGMGVVAIALAQGVSVRQVRKALGR